MPNLLHYEPLLVGAVNREQKLRLLYQCDDEGENISGKNDSYCELTGLYWIWKNVTSQYIGLVHYRRYFADIHSFGKYKYMYLVWKRESAYKLLDGDELVQRLGKHELIVKKSRYYKDGTRKALLQVLSEDNLCTLEKVIREEWPDYIPALEYWFNSTFFIQCNMFFGKKEVIDRYCEWVFPILRELDDLQEKKVGICYKNREIGYFAEVLFSIWLKKNKIDYIFIDVVNVEGNEKTECVIDIKELKNKVVRHLKQRH